VLSIILTIIVAMLALIFVAAAFAPDNFAIQSEVIINRPARIVFDYVKYLKNQANFNKWVMQDPNARRTYTGEDGAVGCICYWDSDNKQVGKGEQEITQLIQDNRIDWALRFKKPFENEADTYMEFMEQSADSVKTLWVFSGKLTYMMKVMHIVFSLRKMLARDMQITLNNLKVILEKSG